MLHLSRYLWKRFHPNPGAKTLASSSIVPARSWLYASKTGEGFKKAVESNADVIILDLEDSVPLELKGKMREEYKRAIEDGMFTFKTVYVRVNEITNEVELVKDIKELTVSGVSGFLIPKTHDPYTIKFIEGLVSNQEKQNKLLPGSIKFIPMIETAYDCLKAEAIALASGRIKALSVGSSDFMADSMCKEFSPTYDALLSQVCIAAKAAKIEAIAGPCEKLDPIPSEKFYRYMKACGFNGAMVLNPCQTILVNREFSCTPKEVSWAKKVQTKEGISTLQLSVQEHRQIIGPPHYTKATNILKHKSMIDETEKNQRPQKKSSSKSLPRCNVLHGRTPLRGLHSKVKVGQFMYSPFEITVTESWKTFWDSSFMSSNRLTTSNCLASKLGLPSIPFPLIFVNTIAIALIVSSFSETARVHLGCYNAKQHHPVYPGDTVRGICQFDHAHNVVTKSGTGRYTIVHSSHGLMNQNDEVVFTVQKRTMFAPLVIDESEEVLENQLFSSNSSSWKQFILSKTADTLTPLSSQPALSEGDLIFHNDYKTFGKSETTSMCKLFKLTNPHHHNTIRYSASEILVPGPFIIAAMFSNADMDLGDVVYEEYPVHTNVNKVNPGDQIGTITYVVSVQQMVENPGFEEITLKQIGVKNFDLEWLEETGVPASLFDVGERKSKELEKLCAAKCPLLYKKIACQAERKIVRVKK